MSSILNPEVSGWGIFAFKKLKPVLFSELRNERIYNEFYETNESVSFEFFIDKLAKIGIFDTLQDSFSLKHFYKIQKISNHFVEFQIFHSFGSKAEIEHEFLYNQQYDYIAYYYFDDLINTFSREKAKFYKKSNGKNYIKIKYLPELLKLLKKYEIGQLESLILK